MNLIQKKINPSFDGLPAARVRNLMEQIVMSKISVVNDGDFVVFTECDYEIPVRDLSSQYWIAEWIRHMSEKTWVTKEMLGQFASIIQQINTVSAK